MTRSIRWYLVGLALAAGLFGLAVLRGCLAESAQHHVERAAVSDGKAQVLHQVADQHKAEADALHRKADKAAQTVSEIRQKREDLEPTARAQATGAVLEFIEVQAQEIQALNVEVVELRAENGSLRLESDTLRKEIMARVEAEEHLRKAVKDLQASVKVGHCLKVGGVVIVGTVTIAGAARWIRRH